MDPASGMHEGNVEEENTVELLRDLLHSDDDAQGPGGDFQGPPQQATVPRPTVGGKGVLAETWELYMENKAGDEGDSSGDSRDYDSEDSAQRRKFDEVFRYGEVLDSIIKKEGELEVKKRQHKAARKREYRQLDAACKELRNVENTAICGRMFNTVFEKKAKVLDMERNVNRKEFNLARLDQEYLRLKTIRMFYLQQDVNKKEKLDNMFEAELAGHPLGPDPLGALQRHQDVKRAHDAANDARLAKRPKLESEATTELEPDTQMPGLFSDTDTVVLHAVGHTSEELDKQLAKIGNGNLLEVAIDGCDQQAQCLPL